MWKNFSGGRQMESPLSGNMGVSWMKRVDCLSCSFFFFLSIENILHCSNFYCTLILNVSTLDRMISFENLI